jgi:hypothetical protein
METRRHGVLVAVLVKWQLSRYSNLMVLTSAADVQTPGSRQYLTVASGVEPLSPNQQLLPLTAVVPRMIIWALAAAMWSTWSNNLARPSIFWMSKP